MEAERAICLVPCVPRGTRGPRRIREPNFREECREELRECRPLTGTLPHTSDRAGGGESPLVRHVIRSESVERSLTLAEYEHLFGHPLIDACHIHPLTGEVIPAVTIVTDNGGPFKSFNFERFIVSHPERRHVRTKARTPGQNGSRERGFGSLKYERLFLDEIPDALTLVERAEDYRTEYNTVRPHEAIAWDRPTEVRLGRADPTIPTFETKEDLPTT